MRDSSERSYKERVLRVLVYIQNHLDETISLEDLARIANFSPYHFHRIFRGMVGESVMGHIRRLRLERAAHRLKFSHQPVTQIAFESGYEAHEAFTRAFSALFGESPSQFRDTHQALPFPSIACGVHYSADGKVTDFRVKQDDGGEVSVSLRWFPVMHIAFLRHVGPYDRVGETWGKLFGWAGRSGLLGAEPKIVGIVHDDPDVTPLEHIRYDAGLVVAQGIKPAGEIGLQDIGGGEYATARHVGPYSSLGETYAKLCGQWLAASGREPRSAAALEFYLNSPQKTPPQDLLTEVCIPLETP